MNQKYIEKMRQENEKILKKMEEEKAKRKRYEELKENPFVKEFISLQDYENFKPMSEKERIDIIKPLIVKRIDSNLIYVDQGTYIKTGTMYSENEYLTFPNNKEADYRSYRDLETGEVENIPMKDVERFEREYLVIHMPEEYMTLSCDYSAGYYLLQRWFFKELLTKPQHEVVKSLMDRETIARIFAENEQMTLIKKSK